MSPLIALSSILHWRYVVSISHLFRYSHTYVGLLFTNSFAPQECSSHILAPKEHSKDAEILAPIVSNFHLPASVEGFERIARVCPRPTPDYNAVALNDVFAMLDAQSKVEHKRKTESPGKDCRGIG